MAGILLAAGASRRFGRPKQLLELDGESLLRRSARIARESGLDPVVVVIRPGLPALRDELKGLDLAIVENTEPDGGMGSSLSAGLAACPQVVAALMVLVCDQPGLSRALIADLLAAWRPGEGRILRPRHGTVPGHPVLFDGRRLPELRAMPSGSHGRALIAAHPEALGYVEVDDPLCLQDVDRVADWQRYSAARQGPTAATQEG
ncbi:MAG: nucleotidyltransferase family protein [Caldilineae bacterium]|nr:nucleotidyltransferase family protein [Chloroflexota bacterium]MCB9176680.1 nucleotidyltransferase family protein [Caldilineae bacterium]